MNFYLEVEEMNKLKSIFVGMMILGLVSFVCGIALSMKEFMEYGLYTGIAGLMGYAVIFIRLSILKLEQKPLTD